MEKDFPEADFYTSAAVFLTVLLVFWLQFFTVPEFEKDALLSQRENFLGNASIENIPDIEVSANDTARVPISAENVQEMHYAVRSDRDGLFWMELENERLSPSPRMTTQTFPPYWHWSPAVRELGGELVVNASGVTPGTYNATVTVWNHGREHDHSGGDSAEFVIEVTG